MRISASDGNDGEGAVVGRGAGVRRASVCGIDGDVVVVTGGASTVTVTVTVGAGAAACEEGTEVVAGVG